MKIAVLGSGTVGEVLADGFRKHGHDVVRGSRDPSKLAAWAQQSGGRTATFAEASADADVVVLAVKGSAAGEALGLAGDLTGKVVLVRVDLNLPMDGVRVTDDTRVRASAPTILELAGKGAKVLRNERC